MTIKLTAAQASAVGIYVVSASECGDERLTCLALRGRTLTVSSVDAAREVLIDACNSADAGDGVTPDRGAVAALERVVTKLREVA